jgi:hypothetical protein
MPKWVKVAIDAWATPVGVADGPLFRSVNRGGQIRETALSEKVVWQLNRPYAETAGVAGIAPTTVAVMPNAGLCRVLIARPDLACTPVK